MSERCFAGCCENHGSSALVTSTSGDEPERRDSMRSAAREPDVADVALPSPCALQPKPQPLTQWMSGGCRDAQIDICCAHLLASPAWFPVLLKAKKQQTKPGERQAERKEMKQSAAQQPLNICRSLKSCCCQLRGSDTFPQSLHCAKKPMAVRRPRRSGGLWFNWRRLVCMIAAWFVSRFGGCCCRCR